MKHVYLLLSLLLVSFTVVFSQTYTVSGGSANPGGTCYCMTVQNETGTSVWEDNGLLLSDFQDTNNDLTWDMEIYLGTNDAGGHGMAFVIQTEGPSAGGNGGAPLGYGGTSGIVPSIAVEIDTNPNGFDATTDDHLAIHLNGDHKVMAPGTSAVSLPNMEDGAYHHLNAVWHYDNVTPANSSLSVTIDGSHSIVYQIDPASIFPAGPAVYVGFTAGTNGLATNNQKVSFGLPGGTGSCSVVTFPVEFASFEATTVGDHTIQLDWETASELNNDYFEILRSADDQSWYSIAVIDGQGSSQQTHAYQWKDDVPFSGKVFYQIKQVDFNGEFSFSDKLEMEVGRESAMNISLFPNPAKDLLTVRIRDIAEAGTYHVDLYRITGEQLRRYVWNNDSFGQTDIELDLTEYARGAYLLKIQSPRSHSVKKLIVE